MPLTAQQALAKMAEAKSGTSSQNVKTAPAGQPKAAPAPGQSSNATAASAGDPKVAPAPGKSSNATTASGQAARDSSPDDGARGKANTGTLAMTKAAGFAMGMAKAAQDSLLRSKMAALEDDLSAAGIPAELFDALAMLKSEGVDVQIGGEMGVKLAAVYEKAAKEMPEFFAKKKDDDKDSDDKDDDKKKDKKSEKKDDKDSDKKKSEKKDEKKD